jgi:rubrerythrin
MASLKGGRTDQNLRPAFSDASRFNRLSPSCARDAAAESQRQRATLAQAATDHDGGHLDFLAAGYDTSPPSGNPLGSTAAALATAIATMTDDNIAMYAGPARTAHDEGFEETAVWFETVAINGRSHAGEMRRALDNMR